MDKAPDAFRTISEVADDLKVPQHVLRFWESRFNQIKPMKRAGGRRYYRPDDVDLLRGIHHLLYGEGYTIRGVQRILQRSGPEIRSEVWQPDAEQPPHGVWMTTKKKPRMSPRPTWKKRRARHRIPPSLGGRMPLQPSARPTDVARGLAEAAGGVVRTRRMPPAARQRDRRRRNDLRY